LKEQELTMQLSVKFGPMFSLLLVTASACCQVYVSPHGSDADAGTAKHPVQTLQHALELSRGAANRRIELGDGTYRLRAPLHLLPSDSGSAGHDLVFTAAPGAHPVVSGGIRVEHWSLSDRVKHIWVAEVSASVANTRQMYINGQRATRTRGRMPVALTKTATGYTAADDSLAGWKNPADMELVYTGGNAVWSERSEGLGSWTEPRCPIQSIDGATITMAQPCWDNSTKRVMLPSGARTANLVGPMSVGKQPEYLENAYELLGTPGEFYFDRNAHRLYYVPRDGEEMLTADVELPELETLVDGIGSAATPAHNIVFFRIAVFLCDVAWAEQPDWLF
jgi:hypothetical protein